MPKRRRIMWVAALSAATILVAAASTLMVVGAAAGDPVSGIPPDGPAGQTYSIRQLARSVPVGTMITTSTLDVTKVLCPNCESATAKADFWVSDGSRSIRVHVPHTWQATWNVKKQNFVPAVGQDVVVQGRLESSSEGEKYIRMKRFGERDHAGPSVHAYEVANGKYATGTYVWLKPVKVLNVARWDDGDYTFDVRDPAGGGFVRVELTPPFFGELRIPEKDETVTPFGMVRRDPDHGWWEIHPVRCWSPTECVPLRSNLVRNGPPAGTPARGGGFLQGTEEPRWIPVAGSAFDASFQPSPNSNEWWIQVTVTSNMPLRGVDASVNNGAWQALSKSSWGDWVRSLHAPQGSDVQFRATSTDGQTDTSSSYSWPPRLGGAGSRPDEQPLGRAAAWRPLNEVLGRN